MKLLRMTMAVAALALVASLAYVAQEADNSGAAMVSAAQEFLSGLKDEQKEKATFPFDSKERFNWNFVPLEQGGKSTRKGLPLEEMTAEQKKAALDLVRAGTSPTGNNLAVTIMSLEAILRDAEKSKGKGFNRNPEWYYFTVFGTPSKTASWGWRVEGHHLSLNFTMQGTKVVSTTPNFYGANPAEIKMGDKKGTRVLGPSEQLAFDLFKALDAEQAKVAYREKGFPEPTQKSLTPDLGEPVGLPAAKMTPSQRDLLTRLIKTYTDRMPPEVAAREQQQVREGGFDKIHFAFTGSSESGKAHTYRVHGPRFVIEFKNDQRDGYGNPANHIHSVWRRIEGDFGLAKGSS